MPNEDIVVGMKIKIDEESIAEETRRAEEKINKKKKGAGAPSDAKGEKEDRGFFKNMQSALKDGFKASMKDIEAGKGGRAALGTGTKVFMGGVGALLALALIKEIKDLLNSIKKLAVGLAKFDPIVFGTLRKFEVSMRGLAIQLVNVLEPALTGVIELLGALINLGVTVLKPLLVALAAIIGVVTKALAGLANLASKLFGIVNKVVGLILEGLGRMLKFLSIFFPGVLGDKLKEAANWLLRAAEQLGKTDPLAQASAMNQAFIKALSDISRGGKAEAERRQLEDDKDRTQERKPASTAKERRELEKQTPVVHRPKLDARKAPVPDVPGFNQQVNFDMKVKLMHEEEVQRAIEHIRWELVKGIKDSGNQVLLLASMFEGKTAVDLAR